MAPTNTVRSGKEKRLKAITSFGDELQSVLSGPSGTKVPKSYLEELERNLRAFPNSLTLPTGERGTILDSNGTALWNLCTRLRRGFSDETPKVERTVVLMARVYAFFLLDCAEKSGQGNNDNAVRVMKVSLKIARNCLDEKQYDLALRVMEKTAEYEERLTKPQEQLVPEDTKVNARLSAEYFILRTMLEWRLDRLSVAEHMYNKAALSEQHLDPCSAENLADVLYEMGKEQLGGQQFELAVKWLERAYDILMSQELVTLSSDANELRISVIQCSVKALLRLQRQDASEKAQSLVNLLESEIGDKLVVLLLKLELFLSSTAEVFDSDGYGAVLHRMIGTVTLTEPTFKLLMHHIRKLHDKSPSLACRILDELMRSRLFEDEREPWVDSVLVNRIWMATNQRDSSDVRASVREGLSVFQSNLEKPISASATFAVHTLLWKRIDANFGQGQYEAAEGWCQLAAHDLFKNTGDLNKAKIMRKLLLCALARQDLGGAREVVTKMDEAIRNDPQTQFLMYKLAVRSGDVDAAQECLAKVYESSAEDANLLYACVLDAQEMGDKRLILDALQRVLQKCEYKAPATVHLPALLRLTIRLAANVLEESQDGTSNHDPISLVEQLCQLFEGASNQAQRSERDDSTATRFDINEVEWFSKNSYNLAVKHCADWEPPFVIRLLKCCILFIDLYPADIGRQTMEDISLRRLFCDYLATVVLVAQARVEDNIETQLQKYLLLRGHVSSYDKNVQEKLQQLEGEPAADLLKKLSVLISYDFEAAVQLKAWDDLTEVIVKADICKSMKVYEVMADCILSCDAPTHVLIATLKRIVNATWSLEGYDITKLSRYMRCLLQYALPDNGSAAEELLDSISGLAHSASESDIPYPTEELEWIATTAFNCAVDFYCAGQDTTCKTWASKAITIASFCPDDGALQRILEEKFMGLSWEP